MLFSSPFDPENFCFHGTRGLGAGEQAVEDYPWSQCLVDLKGGRLGNVWKFKVGDGYFGKKDVI